MVVTHGTDLLPMSALETVPYSNYTFLGHGCLLQAFPWWLVPTIMYLCNLRVWPTSHARGDAHELTCHLSAI
jgi:hypothetical protein